MSPTLMKLNLIICFTLMKPFLVLRRARSAVLAEEAGWDFWVHRPCSSLVLCSVLSKDQHCLCNSNEYVIKHTKLRLVPGC